MKIVAAKLSNSYGDGTEIATIDKQEDIVKLFRNGMLSSEMDHIFYNGIQYYSEEVFVTLDDDENAIINIYVSEVESTTI